MKRRPYNSLVFASLHYVSETEFEQSKSSRLETAHTHGKENFRNSMKDKIRNKTIWEKMGSDSHAIHSEGMTYMMVGK